MRIFVCVKQVPDTETKIKLNADQSGIDDSNIKWIMNPYDEFAVEEALKLKQAKGADAKVTIVSLGPKKRVVEAIRTALAMGADDGIVVDTELKMDRRATSAALAKAIEQEGDAGIVFTGKLAIDDNEASVTQMLADQLNLPHATVISKFSDDGDSFTVEREVEGGTKEVIQLKGACVVGANKGLNQPRYASLPGIMKAKKKPVKEIELSDLGIDESHIKAAYKDFQLPPEKPPVKMIEGEASQQAAELVNLLRDEAKVI